jgi:hypothetical protein
LFGVQFDAVQCELGAAFFFALFAI